MLIEDFASPTRLPEVERKADRFVDDLDCGALKVPTYIQAHRPQRNSPLRRCLLEGYYRLLSRRRMDSGPALLSPLMHLRLI